MKKVFYFLSQVPEWIDIVNLLKEKKGWEPILWATTETLQDEISKVFPQTKIIDLHSHRRGELDKDIYLDIGNLLDKNIIKEYIYSEKTVLGMMNRMDPIRHNFNYHQRVQLYYRTLMFWISMFDKYRPDIILFEETPHLPFEYIMHEVAIKKGIKILRFNPTYINKRLLLFGKINKTPKYLTDEYNSLISKGGDITLSDDIDRYYQNLQRDYKYAKPFYMKKNNINIIDSIDKIMFIIKRFIVNKSVSTNYRTKDSYLEYFLLRKYIKIYYTLLSKLYKKSLLKEYNKLSQNIDLSRKYIYVPLHYQPERTTSPEGDIYENQWLMIELLSKTIPNDWLIYVKEHVSQFRKDFNGHMGRNIEFYKELLLFKNVKLVSLDYNSFDLIDNSQFVATVTGTVAIESIARDKRALVFGHPWFEICEGITKIENKEDIEFFLKDVFHKKISKNLIKLFFKLVDDYSLCGNHNGSIWSKDFPKERNIENIFKIIDKYENKI